MIKQIEKTRAYLDYLERHYNNVQKAWQLINDKCPKEDFRFLQEEEMWQAINLDVINHDESKLSKEEFTAYRKWFFPINEEEKDKKAFDLAWAHHKKHNLHHWQHWTQLPYTEREGEVYLVSNVIDWVAMSMEFGGTAKEYYDNNKDKIKIPEWAEDLMYKIYDCIYPT